MIAEENFENFTDPGDGKFTVWWNIKENPCVLIFPYMLMRENL